jgi:hypothetical protein
LENENLKKKVLIKNITLFKTYTDGILFLSLQI